MSVPSEGLYARSLFTRVETLGEHEIFERESLVESSRRGEGTDKVFLTGFP